MAKLRGTCVRTRTRMRASMFLHVPVPVLPSVVGTYRDDVLHVLDLLSLLGVAVDPLERIPVNLYISNTEHTLRLTDTTKCSLYHASLQEHMLKYWHLKLARGPGTLYAKKNGQTFLYIYT